MSADDGPHLPVEMIEKLRRLGGGGRPSVLMRVVECLKQIDIELVILQRLLALACTRFRRHRVRCFDGAGGGSWRDGSLLESSSLRRCG